MKDWWPIGSLRLRLTLWYAATSLIILLALGALLLTLVHYRLSAELDRQLRSDSEFVSARLEHDDSGGVLLDYESEDKREPKRVGHHDGEDEQERTQSVAWFEVWSPDSKLLLRRRPGGENPRLGGLALAPPALWGNNTTMRIFSAQVGGLPARVLDRAIQVDNAPVTLRVIRSESELRSALAQIGAVLALGLPLAAILSAASGYLIARQSLAPVATMAARARQITAERLSARLPVSNPQDELGQLAAVFNETLGRLENSFAELRRFSADASHELRTPLTALRAVGEASLRAKNNVAGACREAVVSMLEEAQHLSELVEGLLFLARADSDAGAQLRLEAVVLEPLLAEVRESLLALAEEKAQRIAIEIGPSAGSLTAQVDRALLRQALLNLIHNAIRYSPRETEILLRLRRREKGDNRKAVVEVADEGPGIAPEHRDKVFERFYRIDKARSREEATGAGLGLAIARWAVERQGGRIELDSAPDAGSVFRVILPTQN
jgi:heavy metal sensor kinase